MPIRVVCNSMPGLIGGVTASYRAFQNKPLHAACFSTFVILDLDLSRQVIKGIERRISWPTFCVSCLHEAETTEMRSDLCQVRYPNSSSSNTLVREQVAMAGGANSKCRIEMPKGCFRAQQAMEGKFLRKVAGLL